MIDHNSLEVTRRHFKHFEIKKTFVKAGSQSNRFLLIRGKAQEFPKQTFFIFQELVEGLSRTQAASLRLQVMQLTEALCPSVAHSKIFSNVPQNVLIFKNCKIVVQNYIFWKNDVLKTEI